MIERNELDIDIKFEASSIKSYKIVRPNQYVIHLRSFQGGFAYSDKTGVCSPAYTILVPNEKLSTAFLKYYFTSQKFINSLRIVTYGIRDGRSISVEEFLQLKVAIPDVARQQHIVHVMQLWEEKIKTEESYLSKLQHFRPVDAELHAFILLFHAHETFPVRYLHIGEGVGRI